MTDKDKRDEVLLRLLRTKPKPHDQMTKADQDKLAADMDEVAKALEQTDPDGDGGPRSA